MTHHGYNILNAPITSYKKGEVSIASDGSLYVKTGPEESNWASIGTVGSSTGGTITTTTSSPYTSPYSGSGTWTSTKTYPYAPYYEPDTHELSNLQEKIDKLEEALDKLLAENDTLKKKVSRLSSMINLSSK